MCSTPHEINRGNRTPWSRSQRRLSSVLGSLLGRRLFVDAAPGDANPAPWEDFEKFFQQAHRFEGAARWQRARECVPNDVSGANEKSVAIFVNAGHLRAISRESLEGGQLADWPSSWERNGRLRRILGIFTKMTKRAKKDEGREMKAEGLRMIEMSAFDEWQGKQMKDGAH